ncbi:MAG: Mth938-like domain-containing protein [Desulfobacteraceae bacterium]|nr:Mth938-like domain-containing protein [Desulfobacteraceae bacterium]
MNDCYSFGKMTIKGKEYREDLILLPNGSVLSPWIRKSGHRLGLGDLDPVLDSPAKTLVIGTGKPGLMRPHATLVADLQEKGITAMVMSSKRAAEKFNTLAGGSDDVAACFHLTC